MCSCSSQNFNPGGLDRKKKRNEHKRTSNRSHASKFARQEANAEK